MFIIKVYFSSSSKGESRCFQINTNDLVDSRLIVYIQLKNKLLDFDIVFKFQIYLKRLFYFFGIKNVHRNLALMILTATQSHQETSNVIAEMDSGEPVVKMVHV